MNIETTKLELMHLLLQTQKESVLTKIRKIFEEEQNDWWDDLSQIEQEEIKLGISQADQGQFIDNKSAMNRFDKWH